MDATGLPSGTVYPILRRIDREALVSSRWESETEAHRAQRPLRRYYELTAAGERLLAESLSRYRALHEIVPRARRKIRPTRRPVTP
ncbi:MAG: PadR family transcriptional regulator [Luteitalea sp.]|nr:PadR family transcriptional regulator [Luteitalea sp.]